MTQQTQTKHPPLKAKIARLTPVNLWLFSLFVDFALLWEKADRAKKKIFTFLSVVLLLLASLACSATTPRPQGGALVQEGQTATLAPQGGAPMTPTSQPSPTPLATALPTCAVTTGYPEGTVNLRACAGLACQVVTVLSEGDALTIITIGEWNEVQTADGLTGFIHAKYCKGR